MKVQTRNQVIIDLLTEYDDNDVMIVDIFDKPCVYDVAENYEMHLNTNQVTRVLEMVAEEYDHTNGINYNTILDAIDSVRSTKMPSETPTIPQYGGRKQENLISAAIQECAIEQENVPMTHEEVNEAAVQSFPTDGANILADWLPDDDRGVLRMEGVNLSMLERQRKQLNVMMEHQNCLGDDDRIALLGIEAMLDAWSDARYHEQGAEELSVEGMVAYLVGDYRRNLETLDMEDLDTIYGVVAMSGAA